MIETRIPVDAELVVSAFYTPAQNPARVYASRPEDSVEPLPAEVEPFDLALEMNGLELSLTDEQQASLKTVLEDVIYEAIQDEAMAQDEYMEVING